MKKIVVAISGASGSIYGIRLLEELKKQGAECHLILSDWARQIIGTETSYSAEEVLALADQVYDVHDLAAPVSSGSFRHDGMVVAPCSVKTLASIWCGLADNLISRAADVSIKEHRPLVLMVRETPLSPVHLRNMHDLSLMGVRMVPPIPSFYSNPQTIDDLIDQSVGRVLDQLGFDGDCQKRWGSAAE